MSGTTSISGLVSGLDTTTIISQLMQIESQQQTQLKTRVTSQQTTLSALQSLNTKMAAIATAAQSLSSADTWNAHTTTTSSTQVSATATAAVQPGAYSFTVLQTATAQSLTFAQSAATTDVVLPAGSTTVTLTDSSGNPTTLDTGDGTLGGLISAINGSSAGLRASTVKLDDGTYRLSVTAKATGAASAFTLTASDGSAILGGASVAAGQDAAVTIGADTVHSSTNTFSGVLTGLSFTVAAGTAANTAVTVNVTNDVSKVSSSVKSLIDQVNAVLTEIGADTAYDTSTSTGGPLVGSSTARNLRDQLLSTVTAGVGGKSLADVGIGVDRSGAVTFDQSAFETAFTADPSKTASYFVTSGTWSGTGSASYVASTWRSLPGSYQLDATTTGGVTTGTLDGTAVTGSNGILTGPGGSSVDGLTLATNGSVSGTFTLTSGFAGMLARTAQLASDSVQGSLTSSISSTNDSIKTLNDSIAAWDVRLQAKQDSLQAQYAALETTLGQLQSQSAWLSSQISSLSANSSASKP
ncbi:MAG: flagellar filament capping protein FliD [Nocardioidaceae bacterium]